MTVLQVHDGHGGTVVGTVDVDGTLETDDPALRERYEDLTQTTTDGDTIVPYTDPEVEDDGTRATMTVYVRAGDPEFLRAVAAALGGRWVGEADEGSLPPLDPATYDGVDAGELWGVSLGDTGDGE